MFVPLARLLRRSEPRSREDELVTLRARFRAQPSAREAGSEAVASARRLRELRVAMAATFSNVEACHGCAKKRPEPYGHWAGGACCGSRTLDLFSPAEVASLALAGVAARHLEPPRGDHAGCAFRGATGCTLAPEQRPNVCVRYICLELRAEVHEKPEWRRISELGAALRDEFTRFEELLARSKE
ncbi:MAG TPA: hypothetical protein VGH28_10780 [Polyangiaceae bacterium]|jgi:hypothetical protein